MCTSGRTEPVLGTSEMKADRALADIQRRGYLLVCQPSRCQCQHRDLALR